MLSGGRYPVRSRRPKRFFDAKLGSASQAAMTAFNSEAQLNTPGTVNEAMARPDAYLRRRAMQDVLRSLAENNARELVDLPPGAKLTGSRLIFDLKRDAAGNLVRFKARLVVRGFDKGPASTMTRCGRLPWQWRQCAPSAPLKPQGTWRYTALTSKPHT